LKWAAPAAGGGMTLLTTLTLSGTSTTSSTFSSAYKELVIYVRKAFINSNWNDWTFRLNGDFGTNYVYSANRISNTTNSVVRSTGATSVVFGSIGNINTIDRMNYAYIRIMRPSDTDVVYFESTMQGFESTSTQVSHNTSGVYKSSAAITSITFGASGSTFSEGTALIYGVN
jgi:hypothetical protein